MTLVHFGHFVVFLRQTAKDLEKNGVGPICLNELINLGNIMFRFLFLLFLLIPLVEIYFLIQVGKVIGAGWTIFLVVGTAVLGAYLLRLQGFNTLQRAQTSMARGEIPAIEMMEGMALLVSGALLLTPGFFTDALGFLLLVPAVRKAMIGQMLKNSQIIFTRGQSSIFERGRPYGSASDKGDIIEGEVVDDDEPRHLR